MTHTNGELNRLETEISAVREALINNLKEHRELLERQRKLIKQLKEGFGHDFDADQ
jgi:hypothetical protein